eukprot:TRINITY_DN4079_c0_g1_i1.p1 TRINITY_DN4079_c0_g1~~TRINITY_DN4079_c0_g1_i1.p1  ORF type:complete len:675 (+),score=87.11 TRINITY_DN4079_c0_g1_i1:41-2026(+)
MKKGDLPAPPEVRSNVSSSSSSSDSDSDSDSSTSSSSSSSALAKVKVSPPPTAMRGALPGHIRGLGLKMKAPAPAPKSATAPVTPRSSPVPVPAPVPPAVQPPFVFSATPAKRKHLVSNWNKVHRWNAMQELPETVDIVKKQLRYVCSRGYILRVGSENTRDMVILLMRSAMCTSNEEAPMVFEALRVAIEGTLGEHSLQASHYVNNRILAALALWVHKLRGCTQPTINLLHLVKKVLLHVPPHLLLENLYTLPSALGMLLIEDNIEIRKCAQKCLSNIFPQRAPITLMEHDTRQTVIKDNQQAPVWDLTSPQPERHMATIIMNNTPPKEVVIEEVTPTAVVLPIKLDPPPKPAQSILKQSSGTKRIRWNDDRSTVHVFEKFSIRLPRKQRSVVKEKKHVNQETVNIRVSLTSLTAKENELKPGLRFLPWEGTTPKYWNTELSFAHQTNEQLGTDWGKLCQVATVSQSPAMDCPQSATNPQLRTSGLQESADRPLTLASPVEQKEGNVNVADHPEKEDYAPQFLATQQQRSVQEEASDVNSKDCPRPLTVTQRRAPVQQEDVGNTGRPQPVAIPRRRAPVQRPLAIPKRRAPLEQNEDVNRTTACTPFNSSTLNSDNETNYVPQPEVPPQNTMKRPYTPDTESEDYVPEPKVPKVDFVLIE